MVQVRKREGETAGAMLRRFTRRVQQSGALIESRKRRFYKYPPTKIEKRARALRRIKTTKERTRLAKLGKPVDERRRK
ncbi:MAG: 30S ribosomal protein S21 [bacterium]|nr:30S ribosomal protein S21 [bacterium]